MKVKVDKNKCGGCGLCVSIAPAVFEFGNDGKSEVKKDADLEKNKETVKQAKESCPTQAIEIED